MTLHLLQALSVVWLALLAVAMPRRMEPWAWVAVAVAVRALLAPPHVLMSWEYPYQVYLEYAGAVGPNPLYGDGWLGFMSVIRTVAGPSPDRVNQIDLALSALVAGIVWATLDRATDDRSAARLGALFACVMPLPVAVGATETPLVLCATVTTAGLLGVARADRLGGWLTAVSAALLAHLRPDQMAVTAALGLGLIGARAWGGAALVVVTVVARLGTLLASDGPTLPVYELRALGSVTEAPWGQGSTTTLLDPFVAPFWLVPLAAIGAWTLLRAPRTRLLGLTAAATVVLGTAPYVGLHRVTDLARFHLPPHAAAVLLAALSWPVLRGTPWVVRVALGAVAAAGLWLARHPLGPPLVHDVEDARLRALLPTLPPGTTVRYDASRDGHGTLSTYVTLRFGAHLVPWDDLHPLQSGELVWRGVSDRWDTPRPTLRCTFQAVDIVETPAWDGGLINLGPAPVRVGLERVVSCP